MSVQHLNAPWIEDPTSYLPEWGDRTIVGHLTMEWECEPLRTALEAEGRRREVTCLAFVPDVGGAHPWCRRCGWQASKHV